MKKRDISIGIVYNRCMVCTDIVDTDIMYNEIPSEEEAEHIDNLDGSNLWSDKLCADCESQKEKGILFIVYDEDLTDTMEDPYRLGIIFTIPFEDAKNLVEHIPETGYVFVTEKQAIEFGLPIDEEE